MVALAMASFAACGQTPAPEARTVRISGRVVDEVGCPIPYEAVGLRLPQTFDSLARVPTDSEGRFTFPAVQPMKYELVVRLPYHRPVFEPLDARQGNDVDAGDIRPESVNLCDAVYIRPHIGLPFRHRIKTYRVSGRVVDARGAAIAEALVELRGPCFGYGARTGPGGDFRFGRVVSNEYQLRVRGPGFLPVAREIRTGESRKSTDLGTIVTNK